MAKVVVRTDRCKACQYCVRFCPKGVLAMSENFNARGVHYVCLVDENNCTGCMICGIVCPDVAIEVYR
jgi:2-oxoglutarate ferredoxin oxidoreductase subunit delta